MNKICMNLDTPVIKKWKKVLEKEERKKQAEIDKQIMLAAIGINNKDKRRK